LTVDWLTVCDGVEQIGSVRVAGCVAKNKPPVLVVIGGEIAEELVRGDMRELVMELSSGGWGAIGNLGNFDVTGDVAGGEAVTSIGCPLVALIVNPVEYDSQLEMRMMALVEEGA